MGGIMFRHIILSALLSIATAGGGFAQVTVKVGVLNDQSGVYADVGGRGSVVAAQMAVEDFKPEANGLQVEVVSADHQNKPDIGANIARQWYDRDGVDAIFDVPTSSVALAISQLTREKNRIFVNSGAGTAELTGAQCSPLAMVRAISLAWSYMMASVSA